MIELIMKLINDEIYLNGFLNILLIFKFSITILYSTYIYYKWFYKIFCLILKCTFYTHLNESEKYFC